MFASLFLNEFHLTNRVVLKVQTILPGKLIDTKTATLRLLLITPVSRDFERSLSLLQTVKIWAFTLAVEEFLKEVHKQLFSGAQGVHAIPTGIHIRDDEQVSSLSWMAHEYFRNDSFQRRNTECHLLKFVFCRLCTCCCNVGTTWKKPSGEEICRLYRQLVRHYFFLEQFNGVGQKIKVPLVLIHAHCVDTGQEFCIFGHLIIPTVCFVWSDEQANMVKFCAFRPDESLVWRRMPQLWSGASPLREGFLPDSAEQSAHQISGWTSPVLLPVEEDRKTRCIRQQEPTREEKVCITSWRDVSVLVTETPNLYHLVLS